MLSEEYARALKIHGLLRNSLKICHHGAWIHEGILQDFYWLSAEAINNEKGNMLASGFSISAEKIVISEYWYEFSKKVRAAIMHMFDAALKEAVIK